MGDSIRNGASVSSHYSLFSDSFLQGMYDPLHWQSFGTGLSRCTYVLLSALGCLPRLAEMLQISDQFLDRCAFCEWHGDNISHNSLSVSSPLKDSELRNARAGLHQSCRVAYCEPHTAPVVSLPGRPSLPTNFRPPPSCSQGFPVLPPCATRGAGSIGRALYQSSALRASVRPSKGAGPGIPPILLHGSCFEKSFPVETDLVRLQYRGHTGVTLDKPRGPLVPSLLAEHAREVRSGGQALCACHDQRSANARRSLLVRFVVGRGGGNS